MSCASARHVIGSRICTTNLYDYVQLLEACIASRSLTKGMIVHQHLLKNGIITNTTTNKSNNSNAIVLDKLTRFYITCKEPELAGRVFDEIPDPEKKNNVILWNLMIRAYAWDGPFHRAIDLYYQMFEFGVTPTKYTYPFVLKACSALQAIEDGEEIHNHAKRLGLESDVYVCTALLDFYVKCGSLVEARYVFDNMSSRDVVAWNAMIAGLSLHGIYCDTIELVVQMQRAGLSPNASTVAGVLPVIGKANALGQGKAVHGYSVRRFFHTDVVVGTGLLDMYAKCQCLSYTRRFFDLMGVKNEVTWSALIGAYVTCGFTTEALELFDQMLLKGVSSPSSVIIGTVLRACAKLLDPRRGRQIHGYTIKSGSVLDIMVGNTLLSMYAKCGIIDDAMRFFDEMDLKDTVSYSAIISGCMQNGNAEEALHTFHKMQLSGIDPDLETMIGFLPACSHLAALQHGLCGHSYSIVRGYTTYTSVCNALIDMYSKCGKINTARAVFDRMHNRDIISWNAMIVGYGIHGLGMEALSMFRDMQTVGLKPDDVTFISLLSACSHSGLVDEGKHLFSAMNEDFNIIPRMEHYMCIVDLLGRAGHLDEAHNIILRMPFEPDVHVWSALLAACRIHKNIELGEEVSNKIHSIGPEGTGNFVLLSNIYSAAGRWDDAANVRIMQKEWGFKKSPGCSWVEINGVVHAFVGGDQSHPQFSQINNKLEELLVEMKRLGYCAESSFVFQDVEEEEKERVLLYHSEKLAVAFGILSLGPSKPIIVTKNLRICGDCHIALKYITTITKREITVRDSSRFHHFRDGICNCGEFW
ncbi:pentatricopeptide repeat-containing protein At3g16610 [Cornus florida]|uniref:pentatricopeptide repeat-containing protein At3g16610 n=1 Tax=Cornus florida TaxID=4283 RepID=UPI00289AD578|nr:pentatricopeptide repeat-containing protein At3g16610 [Cornus florida]XP_059665005.1 pentatricopeptide repeat-containing protein At3g16610 [Cornus florida]